MGPLVAPLIAGGVGLAGSLIGSLFGHKSNKDNNQANMELAKYSFDRNLEMWNLQNEYNTPANQRSRIVAAGLNPALLYGNGTLANTASNAPQYTAPHLEAYTNFGDFGMSNAASAFMSMQKNLAEIENITEDSELKRQTQDLQSANIIYRNLEICQKQLELAKTDIEKAFWERQIEAHTKLLEENSKNAEKQGENIEADTSVKEANAGLINAHTATEDALRPHKIKLVDAQEFAARMSGKASQASASLSAQQARTEREKQKLIRAQANKVNVETRTAVEQLKFLTYDQQTQLKAHVQDMVYSAALKGEQVNKQQLENYFKTYLKDHGYNPDASGYQGMMNQFIYGIDILSRDLVNSIGSLF